MTNYYKILGLPTYASIADVKEAYKAKIKLYHPDISNEPDAEEMTKYLNLAKGNLDTPLAKEIYDRKLKRAYLREIQRITKNTPQAATPHTITKEELQEKIRQNKEARKKQIKARYERSLNYFPKKFRKPGYILLMIWGLQLIYSHYFFYYGSLDRTLVILGIGIFFIGICFGASEVYTHYVISSITHKTPHNFERKIGITLVLGFLLGLAAVVSLNEYREYYHLKNNSAYTLATIDYGASLHGLTVVRYEVDDKVYFKKLDVSLSDIIKLSNNVTAVKFAVVNPLICTNVTKEEVKYLTREL